MRQATNDVTIACALDPAEFVDRRSVWEALAQVALKGLRPTADGVELVYAASEEVERLLHQLVRLENECCSFAAWRVSRRGEDELILDVTSEGDGVATVRALFGSSSTTQDVSSPPPLAPSDR
ncbi:MAG TPA: hypothetical protein VFA46_04635 [Actinomycetes bacterium]|jgi:hypothetical protein|nr:hypothetical protein [Actinomycetes bacterium]